MGVSRVCGYACVHVVKGCGCARDHVMRCDDFAELGCG